MRALPAGIGTRLFLGFLATAVPILLLAGWVLEDRTRRALEAELGRRVESLAVAIGTAIPTETWRLAFGLGPGEEQSRTAGHLRQRLAAVEAATGAERIGVWTLDGRLLIDSRALLPIGAPAPRAALLAQELGQVADGHLAHTPLIRAPQGRWVKLGLAPLFTSGAETTAVAGCLVVEAPSTTLGVVHALRRRLVAAGVGGLVLVALAALLLARMLTRRIQRLVLAARRMESGQLDTPVPRLGRDEVGVLAGALESMRAAVGQRERDLRAMLGGVAHEIRNPLGGLVLYAEMLARDPQLGERQQARAHRVLREATGLEKVVAEFLAYARPANPQRVAVELGPVLSEVEESAREALGWTGSVSGDARGMSLWWDAGHLRQVLLNLMLNAMQAAGAGGSVRVRARRDDRGAVVTVEDSGPGVAAEARERIFEPFHTTRAQGAGLGLAIVRRLCQLGGAAIELGESELGGACFRLRFPPGEEG